MFINLVVSATQKFSVHNSVAQKSSHRFNMASNCFVQIFIFFFRSIDHEWCTQSQVCSATSSRLLAFSDVHVPVHVVKHFYGARQILNAFGGRTNDEITHVAVGKLSGCFNVRTILEQRMINCTRDIRLFVLDLVRFLLRFRGSRSRYSFLSR